jgi:hypothetical protein
MVTFKIIQFLVVFVWILNLQYVRAINSRYPLAAKRTASRQASLMLFSIHSSHCSWSCIWKQQRKRTSSLPFQGLVSEPTPFAVQSWPSSLLIFLAICRAPGFHSIIMVEHLDIPMSFQHHSGLVNQLIGSFLHETL